MKRVLLKLSGEALAGDKKTGFDEATCMGVAQQVKNTTFPSFNASSSASLENKVVNAPHTNGVNTSVFIPA